MAEIMKLDTLSSTLESLDAREHDLVAAFESHPVLAHFERLSREQVLDILLQRRFVSLAITPLYDLAIDAFEDLELKRCLREILREEYPGNGRPTHREDLMEDLRALGASWERVVSSGVTPAMAQCIERLLSALRMREERSMYEVRVLSFVRFAGELLVAAEYGRMWPSLRRLGLCGRDDVGGVRSRFYKPHMSHDERKVRFSDPKDYVAGKSHSDQLTEMLKARLLLGGSEAFKVCLEAMQAAVEVKRGFYDPFLSYADPARPMSA
jgi:hypothetical protein